MAKAVAVLVVALAGAMFQAGCSGVAPVRPQAMATNPAGSSWAADNGLIPIAPHVYVDRVTGADVPKLLNIVAKARVRTGYFYGNLVSSPDILFCSSAACYRQFGGIGLGYAVGNVILISPYGARAAIVSHELSHVELAQRIGWQEDVLRQVPQWFDEGTAVMVSLAHEFSDEAWAEACHSGSTPPSLERLASAEDWNTVTGPDGINMQASYGTARQEVVRWYGKVGRAGLDRLLADLKSREDFQRAYRRIERAADAPSENLSPNAPSPGPSLASLHQSAPTPQ